MSNDYYFSKMNNAGVNYGSALIQAKGEIGGARSVFVKLQGQSKNGLVFPPIGGIVVNPFKGFAKAYAGDLAEYAIDGSVKLLKTYEAAEASTATELKIVRNGYRHIPFVGDVLMVAAAKLTTAGKAVTVVGVVEKDTEWVLTLSDSLTVAKGDILLEADKAGASAKAVVQNPNAFFPSDVDFIFDPTAEQDEFYKARYTITPCLANEDTKLYLDKMSPLPASIKALNESKVVGWFNL